MATDPRVIKILESIDASLKRLVSFANARGSNGAAAGGEIASDRDLDGPYGNPEVRFEPRDWIGEPMKGRKLSECHADFLDMLAETFDYFARKAEESDEKTNSGKPVAPYKRKDAARCRGWAQRIRSGRHTPEPVQSGWANPQTDWGGDPAPADTAPQDDDIPFAWLLPFVGALLAGGSAWM